MLPTTKAPGPKVYIRKLDATRFELLDQTADEVTLQVEDDPKHTVAYTSDAFKTAFDPA